MSRVKQTIYLITAAVLLLAAGVAAAEISFQGSRVQGGMLQGRVDAGSRVAVDGKQVRVSPEGLFLVGFGRDYKPECKVEVVYPDGSREDVVLQVERREYDIQRISGLPPSKVEPSAEDLKRIRAENRLVANGRGHNDPRTDFLSGWIWPATGRISGVYGSQRILNGQARRPHFGVDIAAPTGSPVVAPADGVVTMVHPDMFFSGGTLIVDHGHRLTSSFLHLSKILVEEGERVRKGDRIAEIGATGRVTGSHLDWRMNLGKERIDPTLLVPPMVAPTDGKGSN